ncbi:MAG: SIS domain-containing protein [Bdellovibrionaceae bacterium]|nr:SIS domain-containing protein [Bdellovibrio sp.]
MQTDHINKYRTKLISVINKLEPSQLTSLAEAISEAWEKGRQVFICGNGGSAGNAIHIANDFIYGIGKGKKPGMRFHALPANSSIITCLANDEGYEKIFSLQLKSMANKGDTLIVLSGSGNSPNIVEAIKMAKEIGMKSFALLGFSGGKSLALADHSIHFEIDDMQISEDLQLIVMHMVAQSLMGGSSYA